jgi:hypothetical protein
MLRLSYSVICEYILIYILINKNNLLPRITQIEDGRNIGLVWKILEILRTETPVSIFWHYLCFELRVLCLISRYSTTADLSPFVLLVIFQVESHVLALG